MTSISSSARRAALYYFTGSKAHSLHLRRLAQLRGLKLNEYGLYRGSRRIAGATEASIFEALGLQPIAPELREDRGEIAAAQSGTLPVLVEAGDLRGDLHVHTDASDGTAGLEVMRAGARRAGLHYLGIADHGRYLGIVHGLDADGLARQSDAIDRCNADGLGPVVLKGVEVDVLESGELALPDTALGRLDFVVLAIHGHFGLSRRRQTERLLRALDARHATVLAHPTCRMLGDRPPIDADWPRIFARASARPLCLEINAQPARLDLDDRLGREALDAGASFSIASDAHDPEGFDLLRHGVLQARRAWIPAERIVNTLPLAALPAALAATRGP